MTHKLSEVYALVFCRTETIEFLIFFFFARKIRKHREAKEHEKVSRNSTPEIITI